MDNVIYNRSRAMKLGLCISGGGALGIGPLQFLRRLEKDLGKNKPIHKVVDAFAGTSTGSIAAAGLCNEMSADALYDLYKENLPKIFKRVSAGKILTSNYYRYDNSNLKKLLQEKFKKHMYQFPKPIFIPATFLNGKSIEKVWDRSDGDAEQWFAVLSSCSAPTYFDTVTRPKTKEIYCDGGMWANDPIMVLEAGLVRHKEFKDNLRILSFNTGMDHPNTTFKDKSALGWGKYILDEWVARTGLSGWYEACANLGDENVFRVAPKVDKKYAMDDLSLIDEVSDKWDELYDKIGQDVIDFINEVPPKKTKKKK